MATQRLPGTYYIAPANDASDEYAAGYDGNVFASADEIDGDEFARCTETRWSDWQVVRRPCAGTWVELDDRVSVQVTEDGDLRVSCRDTEDDPDDGHADVVLRRAGIRAPKLGGYGDAEEDQYIERIPAGRWSIA